MSVPTYTRVTFHRLLRHIYDNTYYNKAFSAELARDDMERIAGEVDDGKQSLWLVIIGPQDYQRPERAGYHTCIYIGNGEADVREIEEAKGCITPRVQEYSMPYYLVANAPRTQRDAYREAAKAAKLDGVIFWTTKKGK